MKTEVLIHNFVPLYTLHSLEPCGWKIPHTYHDVNPLVLCFIFFFC